MDTANFKSGMADAPSRFFIYRIRKPPFHKAVTRP